MRKAEHSYWIGLVDDPFLSGSLKEASGWQLFSSSLHDQILVFWTFRKSGRVFKIEEFVGGQSYNGPFCTGHAYGLRESLVLWHRKKALAFHQSIFSFPSSDSTRHMSVPAVSYDRHPPLESDERLEERIFFGRKHSLYLLFRSVVS